MGLEIRNSIHVNATLVANEFIDQEMAVANGEYVKVYLYVLRHQTEEISISRIADALDSTESDVRRALNYWDKRGVLKLVEEEEQRQWVRPKMEAESRPEPEPIPEPRPELILDELKEKSEHVVKERAVDKDTDEPDRRMPYTTDQVNVLSRDEDFSQLLYIAQKYMNKAFTPRECEVFAYLYDGLHMSIELLEYLVEYCVQHGHTSIRYIETVALNWYEKGLNTVEEAKSYAESFTTDSFSVMKAFGLTDRKPGVAEKGYIEKWYHDYGFSKDLVLEACNRTMEAIHSPSFRYADKILSEWKKLGIRTLSDVKAQDQNFQRLQSDKPSPKKRPGSNNQFHNFDQRDTDYDAMILQSIRDQ